MTTKLLRTNHLLVFAILAISTIVFFLRSTYTEPTSDDLLYSFILDDHGLGENDFDKKVESLNDAINSQVPQYFYHSGRLPIHVLVQMFAGPWGRTAWNIFSTIIFAASICLFIRLTVRRNLRQSPVIWFIAAVTFLYLFQSNSLIWYSIAGGMNYLFPLFLSLIFILLLRQVSDRQTNNMVLIICALVGFAMGWCQECYSIPLAATTFIYALMKRQSVNRFQTTMFITLWIGTAILVLAPGNFARLGGSASRIDTIINGIILLLGTKLFWIFLILLAISASRKNIDIREFLRKNMFLVSCLGFSLLLGFTANTLPQSFNGIALFSALLSFRLISFITKTDLDSPKCSVITAGLLILLACHQADIIVNQHKIKVASAAAIKQIKSTGTFAIPNINLTATSSPFVNNWFDTTVPRWVFFTLKAFYYDNNITYTSSRNDLIALHQTDYGFYTSPDDFLIPANHIPGDTPLYMGDNYIWARADEINPGDKYKYTYYPISPNDTDNPLLKVKFALFPNAYENEGTVVLPDTNCIKIDSCYRVFPKPGIRKIKSIEMLR
ncbi:MAG: DUF6056 family protein [Pseudoflavonifractor sp.]|nr:DUF6056 family protein [Pseudoflavonifractor sp.]